MCLVNILTSSIGPAGLSGSSRCVVSCTWRFCRKQQIWHSNLQISRGTVNLSFLWPCRSQREQQLCHSLGSCTCDAAREQQIQLFPGQLSCGSKPAIGVSSTTLLMYTGANSLCYSLKYIPFDGAFRGDTQRGPKNVYIRYLQITRKQAVSCSTLCPPEQIHYATH